MGEMYAVKNIVEMNVQGRKIKVRSTCGVFDCKSKAEKAHAKLVETSLVHEKYEIVEFLVNSIYPLDIGRGIGGYIT